jgi:rare lipoprotein A
MVRSARAARRVAAGGVAAAVTLAALGGVAAARASSSPADGDGVQTGTASWYGERHEGKRTASGETFRMDDLTAAHPSLAFGTRVKVTLLRTGRSVVVRINDRFPRYRGRIIDLSRAAAREIGMMRRGTGRVRVEVLAPERTEVVDQSVSR